MTKSVRSWIVLIAMAMTLQGCGPGRAPTGQPPMIEVTADTLEAMRQQFNAAADAARVVVLLSPT